MMYPDNLQVLGLSITAYAAFQTALDVISAIAFFAIGIIIFIRGWRDWMMILISLTMITFGMLFAATLNILAETYPIWTVPVTLVRAVGLELSLIAGFYLFPDGRFVPKVTRWLAVLWTIMVIAWSLFPKLPANLVYATTWGENLGLSFGFYGFWYLTGLVSQIYRYKRVSGPVEKQQTKWVVFGMSSAVIGFILFNIPLAFFPQLERPGYPHLLYSFIAEPLYMLVTIFVPISIAISILKFRLWEVDRIINRSVVYGILTLFLGLTYIGLVLGLRASLMSFTPNPSTITTIISTLAVAAMFTPVRNFLQSWIDKRFFRRKYDTERTLEQFRMSLRNKVDMNSLSKELIALVDKTIQPESVSLWLVTTGEKDREPGFSLGRSR